MPAEQTRDPLDAGIIHHRAGRIARAEACYKRALARKPGDPAALHLLGLAALDKGRPERALQLIAKALKAAPENPDYLHSAGHVLQSTGRYDEAAAHYLAALAVDPARTLTRSNLGNVLKRSGQFEDAVRELARVVEAEPGFAEGWSNLGLAEKERGRLEAALDAFARAEALRPDNAAFPFNAGNALAAAGRRVEAIAAFARALAIEPVHSGAIANMGAALRQLGRLDEARRLLNDGRALSPANAEIRWNLALTRLMAGDWKDGFDDFEARRDIPGLSVRLPRGAEWDGRPIPGRTLLIAHEQGLGDAIQFLRFARDAERQGARVIYRGPRALCALARRISGVAGATALEDALPSFDAWLPLMSLPRATRAATPQRLARGGYLSPPADRMALWRQRMNDVQGLRIGIAWQGNPGYGADAERSVPLAAFTALARVPGVRLVSLQKGPGAEQLPAWPEVAPAPLDLGVELDTGPDAFLDTAAVLPALDLVVTSDTALAHLAGAIGVPMFLALAHVPDWRWGLEGTRTVWYPTVHVFRQRRPGDWVQVFEDMTEALCARIGVHG